MMSKEEFKVPKVKEAVMTVGRMRALLARLPDELPVMVSASVVPQPGDEGCGCEYEVLPLEVHRRVVDGMAYILCQEMEEA